ncbi:MAG: DUF58 domain-containing protein [Cryobacterium sp.]
MTTPPRARHAARLTRRGELLLLSGSAVLLLGIVVSRRDLLFVGLLLVLLPLCAALFVMIQSAAVSVHRSVLPDVVTAGDTATVSLWVQNRSQRPLVGSTWRDTASAGLTVPPRQELPALHRAPPRRATGEDAVRLTYPVSPQTRGLHRSGPLLIERTDPFGLARTERSVGEPKDFRVTPRVEALTGSGLSLLGGDGSSREALRTLSPNADELTAREYRPGDPLRRVNWRATARRGEIMVRQEEQQSNPEARLLLDTTPRNAQAFDLAVDCAASVGVHLLTSGFRVQVIETGPSQIAPSRERACGGLRGDSPVFLNVGAERTLLEALGTLAPLVARAAEAAPARDDSSGASADVGASGGGGGVTTMSPLFAVLVDVDESTLADLRSLRARTPSAVAFLLHTVTAAAAQSLQENGWRCVRVHSRADIAPAWTMAVQAPGRSDGPVR